MDRCMAIHVQYSTIQFICIELVMCTVLLHCMAQLSSARRVLTHVT